MKTLRDDELSELSPSCQVLYARVLEQTSPRLDPAMLEDGSGFELVWDESTADPHPFYVRCVFRFRDPKYLGIWAHLGGYPRPLIAWFHAGRLRLSWQLQLDSDEADARVLAEVRQFFEDWLTGQVVLQVHLSNSVAHRVLLIRRNQVLADARRLFYPWWGRRQIVYQRCAF
jgi:hypothetical protein